MINMLLNVSVAVLMFVVIAGCGGGQRFDADDEANNEKIMESLSEDQQEELAGAMMAIALFLEDEEAVNKAIDGKTPQQVIKYAKDLMDD